MIGENNGEKRQADEERKGGKTECRHIGMANVINKCIEIPCLCFPVIRDPQCCLKPFYCFHSLQLRTILFSSLSITLLILFFAQGLCSFRFHSQFAIVLGPCNPETQGVCMIVCVDVYIDR